MTIGTTNAPCECGHGYHKGNCPECLPQVGTCFKYRPAAPTRDAEPAKKVDMSKGEIQCGFRYLAADGKTRYNCTYVAGHHGDHQDMHGASDREWYQFEFGAAPPPAEHQPVAAELGAAELGTCPDCGGEMDYYGCMNLVLGGHETGIISKLRTALAASIARVTELEKAVRYALATFRALDQYTFEDSDHGLLIAEAVKKLEECE